MRTTADCVDKEVVTVITDVAASTLQDKMDNDDLTCNTEETAAVRHSPDSILIMVGIHQSTPSLLQDRRVTTIPGWFRSDLQCM